MVEIKGAKPFSSERGPRDLCAFWNRALFITGQAATKRIKYICCLISWLFILQIHRIHFSVLQLWSHVAASESRPWLHRFFRMPLGSDPGVVGPSLDVTKILGLHLYLKSQVSIRYHLLLWNCQRTWILGKLWVSGLLPCKHMPVFQGRNLHVAFVASLHLHPDGNRGQVC